MPTTPKVWFITGASKGFGREWSIAALDRGDSVAATARDTSTLDDLVAKYGDRVLPLKLDVTDRAADFDAVRAAHEKFGRIDVVVNNAGYGHFGLVEDLTEADARGQLETNLFGALWVTQAALPFLRAQRSGHIIQVSSIGGITAFPNIGIYNASKWALEGISQALAAEVADFGIKVTIVEPGPYSTDWASASAVHSDQVPGYDEFRAKAAEARKARLTTPGKPEATRTAILTVVDTAQLSPTTTLNVGQSLQVLSPPGATWTAPRATPGPLCVQQQSETETTFVALRPGQAEISADIPAGCPGCSGQAIVLTVNVGRASDAP
jgi:NAD(P)-dependent dehydrogenase (short-subunit alcohol dehydrogenase family)